MQAQVVMRTARFADDLAALTDTLGFRVDVIFPADSPSTAVVSGHGIRIRLESAGDTATNAGPLTVRLIADSAGVEAEPIVLPGGARFEWHPSATDIVLPDNEPSLVITPADGGAGVGRAGMHYRDLLPDRWGGRFISSHITIPDGGPVPDYVHFHRIRFQMIFVKAGWVQVVYEDQGEPFVMHAGDCVLQPPEIRHRVLESSPGLEVIEIGCPAEHETIADWSTELPTETLAPEREFGGQRFVRHVATGASYEPWRVAGWEYRDTGIGDATDGLAGARVARPAGTADAGDTGDTDDRYETGSVAHDTEFAQLVVLTGTVGFEADAGSAALSSGDSVTIPADTPYRLVDPSPDCELLDVTLPATFAVRRSTA